MPVTHGVAGSSPVHSADYVIKNIKKAFNRRLRAFFVSPLYQNSH
jgi:hypothetical protein